MVDLDGAKAGQPQQAELIGGLAAELGLKVQTGGGIREPEQVEQLLSCGVDRVVIGSLAVRDPEKVEGFFARFGGEHITLALDVRVGDDDVPRAATHGWKTGTQVTLWELLDRYMNSGVKHVLCTDIGRDGMLAGPNVSLYQNVLKRYDGLKLQASGGVANLEDLNELRTVGCPGVIVGKALLDGRFTLPEALAC